MTDPSVASGSSPRSPPRAREQVPLLGVGLCSCASLLLELSLARLFSMVLLYHFAFLVISMALLPTLTPRGFHTRPERFGWRSPPASESQSRSRSSGRRVWARSLR